jgi:putative transposase
LTLHKLNFALPHFFLSMLQTFTALWIHVVWSTKNREALLLKNVRVVLFPKMREIALEKGYHLDFINGVEDHVHCLFSMHPKHSVSEVVKHVKGASSHWLNGQNLINGPFQWQDGFAAIWVSPSNVQQVRNYIRNQETHHQKVGFEAELETLNNLIVCSHSP